MYWEENWNFGDRGYKIGKFSESVEEILQELKGQQGIHDGKEIMSFDMGRYPHETVFV